VGDSTANNKPKNTKATFDMKNLIKSISHHHLTALLLLAVASGPALAAPTVPFKGSVQAQEQYNFDLEANPPLMFVDTSGSGNSTHLGRFTVAWQHTVNLVTLEGVGESQFVAANGDCLFTESAADATPVQAPDIFQIVEEHVITGGTGRFAGATGSFRLTRLVNTTTGATSGSFNGSLTLARGN
jgi:hypothetical protein